MNKLKKTISVLLVFALMISLTSCGLGSQDKSSKKKKNSVPVTMPVRRPGVTG